MSDLTEPQVILSGFADESAIHKTAVEQFAAFAAIGLQFYSLRFVDVGGGIKNVMELTKGEITKLRHLEDEYGMNVASIGSPIGKVKQTRKKLTKSRKGLRSFTSFASRINGSVSSYRESRPLWLRATYLNSISRLNCLLIEFSGASSCLATSDGDMGEVCEHSSSTTWRCCADNQRKRSW
jgi:hypothetical protein